MKTQLFPWNECRQILYTSVSRKEILVTDFASQLTATAWNLPGKNSRIELKGIAMQITEIIDNWRSKDGNKVFTLEKISSELSLPRYKVKSVQVKMFGCEEEEKAKEYFRSLLSKSAISYNERHR